jgi:hypothetical protein
MLETKQRYHAFYLFISGFRIEKSHNATELYQITLKIISDSKLKSQLEKTWVFHISFKNGHSLRLVEKDSYMTITT